MKKFKIGMIGFGYWGKLLYRYFSHHDGFTLKRIATRNPGAVTGDFKENTIICTPDELLKDPEIEAVIVASPIAAHFSLVKKALLGGKHVFSEKPLSISGGEAEILAALAEERQLKLFTDYILTFSPAVKKMISLVNQGALGKLLGCNFSLCQLGHFAENVYVDLGCHILSILDMLAPVDEMKFFRNDIFVRDGVVETGSIDFSLPVNYSDEAREISGSMTLSFNHPVKERKITFYGDKGTLIYDAFREKPLILAHYLVDRQKSRDPLDVKKEEFEFDELNTIGEVAQAFYDVLSGAADSNVERTVRISRALEKILSADNLV
jgi:predicted dehydrogenase